MWYVSCDKGIFQFYRLRRAAEVILTFLLVYFLWTINQRISKNKRNVFSEDGITAETGIANENASDPRTVPSIPESIVQRKMSSITSEGASGNDVSNESMVNNMASSTGDTESNVNRNEDELAFASDLIGGKSGGKNDINSQLKINEVPAAVSMMGQSIGVGNNAIAGASCSDSATFPATPARRIPNALIIGSEGCGAGPLLSFIDIHPNVKSSPYDVHFFDRDENYIKGLNFYCSTIPPRTLHQIGIEKTSMYFRTDKVPERVQKMNQTLKMIVIVCEPVRKAVSLYTKYNQNIANRKDFEAYIQNPTTGEIDPSLELVSQGAYDEHWLKWKSLFPVNNFLFLNGDEFRANPFPQLQEVEQVLGLEPFITVDMLVFNVTRGFHCLQYNGVNRCVGDKNRSNHFDVRPELRLQLAKFYEQHNRRFFEMIGKYFNWTV